MEVRREESSRTALRRLPAVRTDLVHACKTLFASIVRSNQHETIVRPLEWKELAGLATIFQLRGTD